MVKYIMSDLTKLTKAQLISVIEEQEENKFDNFKEAFGVSYNTDEEWIDFFKSIQESSSKLEEYKLEVRERELNKLI